MSTMSLPASSERHPHRMRLNRCGLLAAVLLSLSFATPATSSESQMRAEPTGDGVLVAVERLPAPGHDGFVVRFDRPMQFLSIAPREAAADFQLSFKSLRGGVGPLLRNSVSWEPDTGLPLKFLELGSGVGQQAALSLQFSSAVQVQVVQGKKLDTVEIRVTTTGQHTAVATDDIASKARLALTAELYDEAIPLLLQLRQDGSEDQKIFAQEFLGVAREKKGQLSFANAEYERFLLEYPDSLEASRVEDRLSALRGLQDLARATKLSRGTRQQPRKDEHWSTFGSLASSYRYSRNIADNGDSYDSMSLLGLDGDLSARYRSDEFDWRVRFSGGHYQDLRDDDSQTSDRVRYLNMMAETADGHYKAQLGRQRAHNGGVIGRFDGVALSTQATERMRLNFVAGYPVDTSRQTNVETDRDLYGLNVDFEDIWNSADLNVFYIRQNIDGVVDREAVGGEGHYISDKSSLYALVDYDIHFGEINALVLNGNHQLPAETRLNWSLNMRKSPYLSTRNALIGQGLDSIDALQNALLSEDEIEDLANDRTRDSKTASVMLSRPMNERMEISGTLTWLDLSDTPASGGVPAYEGTGGQYYMDMRVTGRQIFGERDTSFVSTRFYKLQSSDIWSFYANSRLPVGQRWSLNPRIRIDHRDNSNDTTQWNFAPAVRAQYQADRHIVFSEGGLIYYRTKYSELDDQDFKIWFAYLGYRYSF